MDYTAIHEYNTEGFQASAVFRLALLVAFRVQRRRQQTARWVLSVPPVPNGRFEARPHHGHVYNGLLKGYEYVYTQQYTLQSLPPPSSTPVHARTPPRYMQSGAPHPFNPLLEALQPSVLNPNDILWGYFLAED